MSHLNESTDVMNWPIHWPLFPKAYKNDAHEMSVCIQRGDFEGAFYKGLKHKIIIL